MRLNYAGVWVTRGANENANIKRETKQTYRGGQRKEQGSKHTTNTRDDRVETYHTKEVEKNSRKTA